MNTNLNITYFPIDKKQLNKSTTNDYFLRRPGET